MTNRVWPADAVSGSPMYTGRGLRQTSVAPWVAGATTARPLGARSGVRPGTPTNTVTATSTTWTVKPHAGVVDAEAAAEAGPYAYAIDADVTGSVNAADATNPRVDVVYVRIDDPAEGDGTATPVVAFGYQAGTAAASPVAPTSWTGSARSMVLAQINVPASGGGAPTVTWVAPRLAAAGGIIQVRNQAERDAITYATADNPVLVYRLDTGAVERNAGAGWGIIAPTEAYRATLAGTLTGTFSTFGSVALPAGRWSVRGWFYFDVAEAAAARHSIRLFNATAGAQLCIADVGPMGAAASGSTITVEDIITLASPATIALQARVLTVSGSQGLGDGRLLATRVI